MVGGGNGTGDGRDVGDAWAAFRNFYWTKSGWAGFDADIIAGIESVKLAFLISALTGAGTNNVAFVTYEAFCNVGPCPKIQHSRH